jgi:outer membrane protein assembly factor BamB
MNLAGFSCALLLAAPAFLQAGDWPQWRGVGRDGHAAETLAISTLPQDLKPAWRIDIGGGFSSPVVAGGKLVYLDDQRGREVVHLVEAQSGKELWNLPFAETYGDEWGSGPRSTPIIDGELLYVQSCNGEFRCIKMADGKIVWATSFEKDFGVAFIGNKANEGTATRRGNNGSGVIEGDRLFLPVGSANGASLACFDKKTGKVLWKSQNDEAAYSSLMVATLAGVRQVIYLSADALMGITLADGKLLWRVPLQTMAKRHAATPVIFGDSVIVNSHTFGLQSFKVTKAGEGLKAAQEWLNREMKINISTPVLVNGYLFSQGAGRNFVCVDASTGRLMWSQEGFGDRYASAIAVGERLVIVTDRGELVLLAAAPKSYTELGRLQICGKTWNHPAYAGGKLYVREGLTSGWKLTRFELAP